MSGWNNRNKTEINKLTRLTFFNPEVMFTAWTRHVRYTNQMLHAMCTYLIFKYCWRPKLLPTRMEYTRGLVCHNLERCTNLCRGNSRVCARDCSKMWPHARLWYTLKLCVMYTIIVWPWIRSWQLWRHTIKFSSMWQTDFESCTVDRIVRQLISTSLHKCTNRHFCFCGPKLTPNLDSVRAHQKSMRLRIREIFMEHITFVSCPDRTLNEESTFK